MHSPGRPARIALIALAAPLLVGVTSAASLAAAVPKGGSSTSLGSLSKALQAEEHATFKVTYVDHPASGATSSITFEQKPPNSLVTTSGGELLQTAGKTYVCSTASGHTTCLQAGSTASDPFASLVGVFNPATIVSELNSLQQEVALKVAGISLSSSTRTVAGKSAKCETVKVNGQSSTWCVTGAGFLAYATATGGGYVQLQNYSSTASSGDFKVPAGATISTMP